MIETKIEWADSTFNPWIGCTKVSKAANGGGGCDGCYAEQSTPVRVMRSRGVEPWGPGAPRQRTSAKNWRGPVDWNAERFCECMCCGWRGPDSATLTIDNPAGFDRAIAWVMGCPSCRRPTVKEARRRVFCASLADVFDNEVEPAWRAELFALIAQTPRLDWLLLTKRIGNAASMLRNVIETMVRDADGVETIEPPRWPWPNVWLGATVVNQAEADRDVPKLLAINARVRFLSIEPMLGPIDLGLERYVEGRDAHGQVLTTRRKLLHWVIAGGESGKKARPMHPDWPRSLRDQCAAAGVPFLFKQWGEWLPIGQQMVADGMAEMLHNATLGARAPTTMRFHRFNDGTQTEQHGKKFAGRHLDGRTHDGFPA